MSNLHEGLKLKSQLLKLKENRLKNLSGLKYYLKNFRE